MSIVLGMCRCLRPRSRIEGCSERGSSSDKERDHPRYAEAVAKEEEEIRRGNLNYPGIGKPIDL